MNFVQIEEKKITGITIRTKNSDEMTPKTARIGGLWEQFFKEIAPNLNEGAAVYGVYYNYESDVSGEFSVMAGSNGLTDLKTNSLEKVSIQSGDYIVFQGKGEMPKVVANTWSKVWDYFASENADYQRAYNTDFELYKGANEIEIYIAVK